MLPTGNVVLGEAGHFSEYRCWTHEPRALGSSSVGCVLQHKPEVIGSTAMMELFCFHIETREVGWFC